MPWPYLFLSGLLTSSLVFGQAQELRISSSIYHNQDEPFVARKEALAMNLQYAPIKELRKQLESALNIKLHFFQGWESQGEAHITVITPLELAMLKDKISLQEMEALAQRYDIQESRLMLLGLGKGEAHINAKNEATYFVIVDSYNLRSIRQMIYYEFIRRGGDAKAFDPTWFFPHITVGYTFQDLHESHGVIKNIKHSLDPKFKLKTTFSAETVKSR